MKTTIADFDHEYDYKQHWYRRETDDPRLAGKDFAESKASFVHQCAVRMAHYTWERFDDKELFELEWNKMMDAERRMMLFENLYGFGQLVIDGGFDELVSDVEELMHDEYIDEVASWKRLHIQCDTARMCGSDWWTKNEDHMNFLYDHGYDTFGEDAYDAWSKKERDRVDAYCAEESRQIKASGGWRGD